MTVQVLERVTEAEQKTEIIHVLPWHKKITNQDEISIETFTYLIFSST